MPKFVIVLVKVIVPSQAKVTVPPPAMATRTLVSVQSVTVPAAQTDSSMSRHRATKVDIKTAGGVRLFNLPAGLDRRLLNCLPSRFLNSDFVFIFVFIFDGVLTGLRLSAARQGIDA